MKAKSQPGLFRVAFVLLFLVFRGLPVLLVRADWTLVMLLDCVLLVSSSALAWSLIRKNDFLKSIRALGIGGRSGLPLFWHS